MQSEEREDQRMERACLVREFEPKISCSALDLSRQKRKTLDPDFELSYMQFVGRCIQVEERFKISINGEELAEVDSETYNSFLSDHMNIEAGIKSFVVMQNDLNPADFRSSRHSGIIERISGAAPFSAQFMLETKLFSKEVHEYQNIKDGTKLIEKRMYLAQLEGREKERLLVLKSSLEEAQLKVLFYRLLQMDVDIQDQCQKLVKSAKALQREKSLKEREYTKLSKLLQSKSLKEQEVAKLNSLIFSKNELKMSEIKEKEEKLKQLRQEVNKVLQSKNKYLIQQEQYLEQKEEKREQLEKITEKEKQIRKEREFLNQPNIAEGLAQLEDLLNRKREESYSVYIAKEALAGFREKYERAMASYKKLENQIKEEIENVSQEIKECFDEEKEAELRELFTKTKAKLQEAKQAFQKQDTLLADLQQEREQLLFRLNQKNATEDARIQNSFLYRELKNAKSTNQNIIGTLAEVLAPKKVLYLRALVSALGPSVNHVLVRDRQSLLWLLQAMRARGVRCTILNLQEKNEHWREKEDQTMNQVLKDQSLDRLLGMRGLRLSKIVRVNPGLGANHQLRSQIKTLIRSLFYRHILAFEQKDAVQLQRVTQEQRIISLSGAMQSYQAFYELNYQSLLKIGKASAEMMVNSLIEPTKEKGKKRYQIKQIQREEEEGQIKEQELEEDQKLMEIQTLQELGIPISNKRENPSPLDKLSHEQLKLRDSELGEEIDQLKESSQIQKKEVMEVEEDFIELEKNVSLMEKEKFKKRKIMEHLNDRMRRLQKQLKELNAARQEKNEEMEEFEAKNRKTRHSMDYTPQQQEELRAIANMLGIKGKEKIGELVEIIENEFIKRKKQVDREISQIEVKKSKLGKVESEEPQEKPNFDVEIRDLKIQIKALEEQEENHEIDQEVRRFELRIQKFSTECEQLNKEIQTQRDQIEEIEKVETGIIQAGTQTKQGLLVSLDKKQEMHRIVLCDLSVAEERRAEIEQLQEWLDGLDSPRARDKRARTPEKEQDNRGKYLKEKRELVLVRDTLVQEGIQEESMEQLILNEERVDYDQISEKLNIEENLLQLQVYALQNEINLAKEGEKRSKKEYERVRQDIEEAQREPREPLPKLKEMHEKAKKHEEKVLEEILQRKASIEEIRRQHRTRFLSCFKHIRSVIHEIYYDLTKQGDLPGGSVNIYAEHQELVHDSIVYLPTPSGKGSTINSGQLSSGELSIATIAFILAAHSYRPSAILIFDEIDQFLDPMAMERLSAWMENRKSQATHFQWMLVTHKFNSAILSSSIISIGIIFKPLYRRENGKEEVVGEGKMSATLHYNTAQYMTSGGLQATNKTYESGFLNFSRVCELISVGKFEPMKKHPKLGKKIEALIE